MAPCKLANAGAAVMTKCCSERLMGKGFYTGSDRINERQDRNTMFITDETYSAVINSGRCPACGKQRGTRIRMNKSKDRCFSTSSDSQSTTSSADDTDFPLGHCSQTSDTETTLSSQTTLTTESQLPIAHDGHATVVQYSIMKTSADPTSRPTSAAPCPPLPTRPPPCTPPPYSAPPCPSPPPPTSPQPPTAPCPAPITAPITLLLPPGAIHTVQPAAPQPTKLTSPDSSTICESNCPAYDYLTFNQFQEFKQLTKIPCQRTFRSFIRFSLLLLLTIVYFYAAFLLLQYLIEKLYIGFLGFELYTTTTTDQPTSGVGTKTSESNFWELLQPKKADVWKQSMGL